MDLGAPELLIILVIGLLIFGSNRLPKLARSVGQASKEFRSGLVEGAGDETPLPSQESAPPSQTPLPASEVTPPASDANPPAS
jgi:TatA/E family protein of Tat protein translocase